ncbi:unnamed protein product [Ixodes persulcatus]
MGSREYTGEVERGSGVTWRRPCMRVHVRGHVTLRWLHPGHSSARTHCCVGRPSLTGPCGGVDFYLLLFRPHSACSGIAHAFDAAEHSCSLVRDERKRASGNCLSSGHTSVVFL